jgi:hypothetical protein
MIKYDKSLNIKSGLKNTGSSILIAILFGFISFFNVDKLTSSVFFFA